MLDEFKERTDIWVYKLYSNKTGELRTVLSRKFITEVGTKTWNYFECVGYFDFEGKYRIF